MTNQRLFIAIDLPDKIAESLVALDPHYRGLIFSAPSQIHLTLAFFAAVDPATADLLEEKLAAISFRAFFLPVTGLGTFPKKGTPHVLWIGVGHATRISFNCTSASMRLRLPAICRSRSGPGRPILPLRAAEESRLH